MIHIKGKRKRESASYSTLMMDSSENEDFTDHTSDDYANPAVKMASHPALTQIETSLNDLHAKVDALGSNYDSIYQDLHSLNGIDSRLCLLDAEVGDATYKYTETEGNYQSLLSNFELLNATVTRQNKRIDSLSAEVVDLKAQSMKNNILFHNIQEDERECCEEKVIHFIQNKLEINPE